MKKLIGALLGIAVVGALVWAAVFYWNNLRGAYPAFSPPSVDISELFDSGEDPLVADGLQISVFADGLGAARDLDYDPAGNVMVSIPSTGKIVSLPDHDGDGKADEVVTIVSGLNKPHGITTRCVDSCQLYVAEEDQVAVFDFDTETLKASNKKTLLELPEGGRHVTRSIIFLGSPNDSTLLISVGSSCDVCDEEDERLAAVLFLDVVSGESGIYATGLRNSVFMALNQVTGDVWATEMGRDFLGDDLPPDEVNIIEEGKNYGWPICYGKNVHDTDYDKNTYVRNPCLEPFETASEIDLPAHSAPLGLAFIPEEGWPEEEWYDLLVAYHGSWNRTEPTGYKIVRHQFDADGNYEGVEDFMTGWISEEGEVLGRPVDILVQPGGKMFVSDDKAGVVYLLKRGVEATPDEEDKSDLIRVETPKPDEIVGSPLTVRGEARGYWYFEASFPVRLLDAFGNELAVVPAQAQGEWMTEDFVPFEVTLEFDQPLTATGTLVLEKDNPSGLPEHADELRIPVQFSATASADGCRRTGCSGELCSDEDLFSTCIYKPEFACYDNTTCERQADGACGWTVTPDLSTCLESAAGEEPIY